MNKKPEPKVGLMLLKEMIPDLEELEKFIDFVQVPTEEYIGPQTLEDIETLKQLSSKFELHLHSIDLSIGSADGVVDTTINKLYQTMNTVQIKTLSDHLGFSRVADVRTGTPILNLPLTDESIEVVVKNIKRIQSGLDCPFYVENNSYCMTWPNSAYSDAEFLDKVATRADCGLLLDIPNMLADARNFDFDPYAFIYQLPKERIKMIHIAGGDWLDGLKEGKMTGGHNKMVETDTWKLLEYTLKFTDVEYIVLERSRNIVLKEITDDLSKLREIISNT